MRVLLVEDEPDVAETLRWGLGAEGYVVDTAGNGVDGLWKATGIACTDSTRLIGSAIE